MSAKRPRGLTPEEVEDWSRVASTASPLRGGRPAPKAPDAEPEPEAEAEAPERAGAPSRSAAARPAPSRGAAGNAVRMDRKAYERMRRGKMEPEDRLDLHGMTLERAEAAVRRFVAASHGRCRLVLVITGKGRGGDDGGPVPARPGVLRRHVPAMLGKPPLSRMVLDVVEAHPRHGGAGALYVYLSRPK